MIQLKNISKTYVTGDLKQSALDDVSLTLRDNEFVAILGPSGSGKTTLLNIIGGLDRYDSGDIIINNVSTKRYKDRQWDSYRNHTIGFVFQSYNLIPHQTVLSNVELALTIGGVSASERKERALKALEEVGLKEQAYKKPNQMSGGQMQRVAIARALVNNPDIVLADEPTGALDTKTSIQVMDLLKEVAKDRLVVMVTHNPELAQQYATRIVKLRDGKITDDSDPFVSETADDDISTKSFGKARMSFATALALSFNNLLTKKGRTILTAFAGSIGIIGIALILSLSQGFQNYIDKIQEDTLTSYPLTITSETADMSSLILSMVADNDEKKENNDEKVKEKQYMTDLASSLGVNDLKSFKKYLEDHKKEVDKDVNRISYSYSITPLVYTIDAADALTQLNPSSYMSSFYSSSVTSSAYSSMMSGSFFEVSSDEKVLKDRYKMLKGRFPKEYDEVLLVLTQPDTISDLLVYSLGLRDSKELKTMMSDLMAGKETEVKHDPKEFTYDDLMNTSLKLINPSDKYKYNEKYDIYEDMSDNKDFMSDVYDKSENLKIVGIVMADGDNAMGGSGIAYTDKLTAHIIDKAKDSELVKKQLENENKDVFSGKDFDDEEDKESGINFEDMISVDEKALSEAFGMGSLGNLNFNSVSEDEMKNIITSVANDYAAKITQGADSASLSAAFIALNGAALNTAVNNYDTNAIVDGKLYLAGTGEASEAITPDVYKNIIDQIASTDPSMSAMTSMTALMDDSDYENLASAVRDMFNAYYASVRELPDYDAETDSIDAVNDGEKTAYGIGGAVTSQMLMVKASANESALTKTRTVINKIVNSYTTYMMAAGIGEATGKIMTPMMNSMKELTNTLGSMSIDTEKIASAFKFNMTEDDLSRLMETMMQSSNEKSYKGNLVNLGYQDIEDPSSISFFFPSFEAKESFLNFLEDHNSKAKEEQKIQYTDTTGILMSSVQTIVNSVSYVLIAFVSISLIVSSIMIAVITLISVMERRKEIGILRAMGASKRNVSSIFNAETFIIGLLSGLVGIGVSASLIPPINGLIHNLTGNQNLSAYLPPKAALILIIISIVLTVVAGFIPSKKASKSDPVIALRAE